jgi:hypothetical protein
MTQVKEWSNQELNRKLAELMGYSVTDFSYADDHDNYDYFTVVNEDGEHFGEARVSEEDAWEEVPDYCTDPAASLEVQTAAIAKDGIQYLHNLSDIVEPDEPNYKQEDETVAYTFEHTVKLLAASPRERSEAAYMVLSQVRE